MINTNTNNVQKHSQNFHRDLNMPPETSYTEQTSLKQIIMSIIQSKDTMRGTQFHKHSFG